MEAGNHSLLVDDHGHAGLAVLPLRAVRPDGLRVVDHDGVHGDLARLLVVHGGDVARVEGGRGRVGLGERHAGVREVGLRHGVVAAHELELHHGAHGGGDAVGREEGASRAVGAHAYEDGDDLDVGLRCCVVRTLLSMSKQTSPGGLPAARPRKAAAANVLASILKEF